MDSSRKKFLRLSLLFVVLFLTLYFGVTLTDFGYSRPSIMVTNVGGLGVALGPESGDTNVALDTFFRIGTMRHTTVKDLQLTPEVPIARRRDLPEGLAGGDYRFYPAEPLEPATTYNASVSIMGETVSWSFTTTSKPLHSIGFFIASNVFGTSLLIAIAVTYCYFLLVD